VSKTTNKMLLLRRNLKRYGLTYEDFSNLLRDQNNLCAICRKPQRVKGKRLFVDHSHSSKRVRGLLCASCNTALGLIEENPKWGNLALSYLKKSLVNPLPFLAETSPRNSPEFREKCRQGNIKTWSDPKLRAKSKVHGRAGALKQWASLDSEKRCKKMESLNASAKRYKESMTPEQRRKKVLDLKRGHRRWIDSLSSKQRSALVDRIRRATP
jgi:hypothetical protein